MPRKAAKCKPLTFYRLAPCLNVHLMTNDNDAFLENDASILATKMVIASSRDLATGVVGYP